MATERAKTNVEAQRRITAQMDAVRPLLRRALEAKDKPAIDKYMAEMERLDRQMRATATITVGGVDVPIGAIGSGIQSGISGLFTAIPDIATAGYNYLAPQESQITSLGELGTKYLGTQNEPMSDEQAYAFRMSQGAGSAAIPSAGTKGLLLGTGLSAADVAVSQATGTPEGLASTLYSVGNLTRAGFKGVQSLRESKKFNDLIGETLPPEEQNVFKQFMFRGQGSDNPVVAAALQKLRSNPKFAEYFVKFDKAASEAALKGIKPRASTQTSEEAATGIARTIQDKLNTVKEARKNAGNDAFEKAFKQAGDVAFIETKSTIETINNLRKQYPDNDAVLAYLTKLENKLVKQTAGGTFSGGTFEEKLTVQRLQGFLNQFGKKAASGDSVVTGLALDDMKKVDSALFKGLANDLSNTTKVASDVSQKKAAGYLIQARDQYKKASDEYDSLIAQGVPKFLQNKSFNEITIEDLTNAYKKTNPSQRQQFREWVSESRAESLKAIDKGIYDDFLKDTFNKQPDGTFTYDLGAIAEKWNTLKTTDSNAAGQIVDALGTNANEFNKRMKDALVFTRKMRVSQPAAEAEKIIAPNLQRGLSAAVGTGGGYSSAKAVDVAMTTFNELFKKQGLTDEQLMKMLLTPEGADFLRQGSLTGASRNTLDALTKIPSTLDATAPAFSAISRLISAPTQAPVEATQAAPEGIFIPEDIFTNEPSTTPMGTQPVSDEVFIPEDIFTLEKPVLPQNDLTNEDKNQLMNILGASPKPSPMSGRNPELQIR
jgi:uncharacterized membrane protein YheB (UPF0754 family)